MSQNLLLQFLRTGDSHLTLAEGETKSLTVTVVALPVQQP